MLVGRFPTPNQHASGEGYSPCQPDTVRKKAIRPLPDTSCMTCASDTFSAWRAMPASAAANRIAGRGLVRPVSVTRIGPLPQQDASVPHQQEDDIHDDPAAMLNLRSNRGVAGSAHSDRLAARPKPTPTWAPTRRLSVLYALPRNKHGPSAGLWITMCTRPANLWTKRRR